MDVKTTFLNDTIDEVYIEQPLRYEVKERETHVLYALKQAPRAWCARMDAYLQRLGFKKSTSDPNLYIKRENDEPVIILLYVEDLLITGIKRKIQKCKKMLIIEFNMNDSGLMHYYLGL